MEKNIIIVTNGIIEKEAAQTLKNLIGEQGKLSAVLWDVKHYKAQEPQMKSTQKVLFIGRNEVANRSLTSINWKFEKLTMRYGWVGSVAVLHLTDIRILWSVEEIKKFRDLCAEQKTYAQNVANNKDEASVFFEKLFGAEVVKLVESLVAPTWQQQYGFLVREFFLKGLDAFMGMENKGE